MAKTRISASDAFRLRAHTRRIRHSFKESGVKGHSVEDKANHRANSQKLREISGAGKYPGRTHKFVQPGEFGGPSTLKMGGSVQEFKRDSKGRFA